MLQASASGRTNPLHVCLACGSYLLAATFNTAPYPVGMLILRLQPAIFTRSVGAEQLKILRVSLSWLLDLVMLTMETIQRFDAVAA